MVTPFSPGPQAAPQQQPALPKTSGALVFQIFNPVNYAEGSGPAAPAAGPTSDAFQRSTQPGSPSPSGNPQQQLLDAYNSALNSRNQAEQARQNYLNLANQLNGQAGPQGPGGLQSSGGVPGPQPQAPAQPTQPGFAPPPPPQADPNQAYQQQLAQQQAAQQAQLAQQQYQQQLQQQQQQMAQYQQQLQQQQAQQAAQQQQAQQAQQQPQQPQQPQGLSNTSVEELNRMISQPQTLQEKVDAMEEIGVRGQGTPETYELLKQEALADTSSLPPGQAQDDANYVRQAALWTMGMLNKAQNSQAPTAQLPGLSAISQIISNKNENPDVKAAAVQALQVIDRSKDKEIQKILKQASKDKNPDVKRLAQEALSGKAIPLPGNPAAAGGAPGGAPGAAPGAAPGGEGSFDPAMLQSLLGGMDPSAAGGGQPGAAGAQPAQQAALR